MDCREQEEFKRNVRTVAVALVVVVGYLGSALSSRVISGIGLAALLLILFTAWLHSQRKVSAEAGTLAVYALIGVIFATWVAYLAKRLAIGL